MFRNAPPTPPFPKATVGCAANGRNSMAPSASKSPPPPPTPHLPRKMEPKAGKPLAEHLESDADRIIRENENLLQMFPPLPKSVMEEKYTKVGEELSDKKPPSPVVPRKPRIDPKVHLELKLRTRVAKLVHS